MRPKLRQRCCCYLAVWQQTECSAAVYCCWVLHPLLHHFLLALGVEHAFGRAAECRCRQNAQRVVVACCCFAACLAVAVDQLGLWVLVPQGWSR